MSRAKQEQAIAMAAIFQAAHLVDQIARQGSCSSSSFEVSIASLFEMNPATTEDIFGGKQQLKINLNDGFNSINQIIEKKENIYSPMVMRYALSLITLERKLAKNSEYMNTISDRLEELDKKANYFWLNHHTEDDPIDASRYTHSSIIAGIDALYRDTISNFNFRIQVQGDPRNLQNSENAARIRALLLAGIRAAILWRQVGGQRWHLIFFKSRVGGALQELKRH
jgi:high frequency lysogenization protein